MKWNKLISALYLFAAFQFVHAQHSIDINAKLIPVTKSVEIEQTISYINTSEETLNEIYFNDWANSFSTKTTPLAERFGENFDPSFHFEKKEDRGKTSITAIRDQEGNELPWERGTEVDILIVALDQPLKSGESKTIRFKYTVQLPDAKFTRFGHARDGSYKLRYWYISPAVYDGEWQAYSNKNTDDLFLTPSAFWVSLETPKGYKITSDLNIYEQNSSTKTTTTILSGKDRSRADIYIEPVLSFETIVTDRFEVLTNIQDKKVNAPMRALSIDRITYFLEERLGEYPFEKMVVSQADYRSKPVYGLNQLPDFISPFPDGFEFDMELLKAMTANYLENTLVLHPRKDYWLYGSLQIYLMMEYVDRHYPNMKIIGNLSDFWVIRWSHVSELEFNDQYPLLYLNMARNNLHQSLSTPKDSLTKYNKNIANDYYGGDGLDYLGDYIGKEALHAAIASFYTQNRLKPTSSEVFRETLRNETELPIDWFFDNFVQERTTIDFKIKKVKKRGDTLDVFVKNRRKYAMPVSLHGLDKEKNEVYKTWIAPFDSIVKISIPAANINRLVLDFEQHIPEFNDRNNYKSVDGIFNRPLQLRLFQDVQDPRYNQLFVMPVFEYNLYDGFTIGPKLYNKTVVPKQWKYKIEPQYGSRSKTIIGKASVSYTENREGELYSIRYGFAGSSFSYDEGLFYRRFTPFVTLAFRNKDLRNNEKQFINIRNVNVYRDPNPAVPDQEPNYSVYNFQYVYSNPNLINYFRLVSDYQLSSDFSKLSATLEYRKLFLNNRQLNVRFFAGFFLFNDTPNDNDFFSYALDRPTDYLFDYNYYGRSEDTGLFSQQIIIAEGGFKSQLEPAFADSWITTVNASTNIWKWIYAYGDAGLLHSKDYGTKAVFDTGVRLSLVADYFEVFFPLYSSLGWEPGLGNYDQRIRFIVTLSPKTLFSLFTREWY